MNAKGTAGPRGPDRVLCSLLHPKSLCSPNTHTWTEARGRPAQQARWGVLPHRSEGRPREADYKQT